MNRQIFICTFISLLTVAGANVFAEGVSAGREKVDSVTAQDQSSKPSDVELTQKIRQELMNRDFSVQGKNVTIVTVDGTVTLKGAVSSEAEKNRIRDLARGFAKNVNNELVVNQ